MNPRLRVLLIGRHFWPHGSIDSAGYLIQLASGLQRRGIHVEVLTPRYASAWTTEMDFREIKVHRPFAASRSEWSVGRYLRNMSGWLSKHAASFDILLADSAREEAIAAIEAGKALNSRSTNCRVVVRVSGYGNQSDRSWWESSRTARRCATYVKRADKIIVINAEDHRGLLSQGFAASTLSRIDDGFDQTALRTPENRVDARRALAAINGDFHAPANEPVAVCVSGMVRDSGIQVLIESARHLVARYPDLHLWFIGDGPRRESIFQFLRSEGIRASIAMPGSFGNMEDVFRAADVFVQTDDTGMQNFLPTAVSAELPIVVADAPQTRARLIADSQATPKPDATVNHKPYDDIQQNEEYQSNQEPKSNQQLVHWFQSSVPKSFRKAVRSAMDDLESSHHKAAALKRNLVRVRPLTDTIDDYARLLDQIRQGHAARPSGSQSNGPSFGAVS